MHLHPLFANAILLDECSQIDNNLAKKVVYALDELPQKPFVGIATDYQQIQPVGRGGYLAQCCLKLPTITLNTIYRTDDKDLLAFQNLVRDAQPERSDLVSSFAGRRTQSGSGPQDCYTMR